MPARKEKTMDRKTMENLAALRRQNFSYACIGEKLGIPGNTVKSICRRGNIRPEVAGRKTKAEKAALAVCRYCGRELVFTSPQKKQFCNDHCRIEYWKEARRKR